MPTSGAQTSKTVAGGSRTTEAVALETCLYVDFAVHAQRKTGFFLRKILSGCVQQHCSDSFPDELLLLCLPRCQPLLHLPQAFSFRSLLCCFAITAHPTQRWSAVGL